jgi:hypothetical protein
MQSHAQRTFIDIHASVVNDHPKIVTFFNSKTRIIEYTSKIFDVM